MAVSPFVNCTEISPKCPAQAHFYGYAPDLGTNLFFTIFFGLATIIHVVAGIRFRTWSFMVFLILGCLNETIGYAGRVIMHYNVWSEAGFQIQISCLITGPAYFAAGVYLTLKHMVHNIDQRYSRLRATWYPWIFISCDLIALGVQGAGGGMAAAAEDGDGEDPLIKIGTNIMIAGVIFQVVVLVFFSYFLIEYFVRVFRHRDELSPSTLATLDSPRFRWFLGGIVLAFLGIFIRCAYRIPELVSGWGSDLMRNELDFIILEGVMICLSTLALTVFHPGWFFPAMTDDSFFGLIRKNRRKNKEKENSDEVQLVTLQNGLAGEQGVHYGGSNRAEDGDGRDNDEVVKPGTGQLST
ncbi:hypothetical protein AJ80_07630 [Polytolypa hystricis UAMH7299]|uniref:Sphingoid long-chain base transporter RSB1 n=1 Tax=Polytolypa hystricis (strain UAMH7299) TaxID=1447883 RepID=A0A2B7XL55_POLH7|nr:hypothetical protein AJ80_07630 [Polytolypa hystricis UAMH7299]